MDQLIDSVTQGERGTGDERHLGRDQRPEVGERTGPSPLPLIAGVSGGLVGVVGAGCESGEDGVDEVGAEGAVEWGAAEQ